VVSLFLTCIGSPCLRYCGHGASIGGGAERGGGLGAIGEAEAAAFVAEFEAEAQLLLTRWVVMP
jgi:hypothetical protein